MGNMTDEKKPHILVPRGYQGRELLKGETANLDKDGNPAVGQCIKCKGTGAIFNSVWLEDFKIVDGKIVEATPKMSWFKCKCYMGQFWIRFHPLNVQARLMPSWEKEIREALEQEKAKLIRESGGSYDPHQDSFLKDAGYKAPQKSKILSLDEIVRKQIQKKGDLPS